MSGVGDGGDEAEGESDELVGPSDELVGPSDELLGPSDELLGPSDELVGPSDELVGPSELGAGVLADEDVGDFAGAPPLEDVGDFAGEPPPEDGEALGVEVVFFLAVVGAEAVGGEVGADAVGFGDPAAAGEGVGELLLPLALGAPAGVGGSAAKTAVMANTATARDRSVSVVDIFSLSAVQLEGPRKTLVTWNTTYTCTCFGVWFTFFSLCFLLLNLFGFPVDNDLRLFQRQSLQIPRAASTKAMPKRAAEPPPSSETQGVKPADSFGDYRSQVSQLLSREEKISHRDQEATMSHSNTVIGAGMSHLKKEDLNVLLRQCVRDLTPEVNEMHMRVCSMKLFSEKATKCNVPAECEGATEDDVKNLLSNPDIVKKLTSQYSNILFHELEDMQQQLESLLDDVVATCRPMTRGEKRDLQKAVMELPGGNRDRIAGIVEEHCRTSGKDFSDEVIANLDQSEDNVMLWRLHFYIGAVENAQKLAS
ncbi:hypothetical protein Bca101_064041 [Brassica carinata]